MTQNLLHSFYCLLNRQTSVKSSSDRVSGYIGNLSNSGKRHLFSTKIYKDIVSFITILLNARCPTAILLVIPLLIVNTVKKFSIRTLAHISDEICEFVPPLVNLNTATSVVHKRIVVCVETARFHLQPHCIRFCITPSMFCNSFDRIFSTLTSARFGGTISKVTKLYCFLNTALTATYKHSFAATILENTVGGLFYNGQSSKFLSCFNQYWFRHKDLTTKDIPLGRRMSLVVPSYNTSIIT